MVRLRFEPDLRREWLVRAALEIAEWAGFYQVTRDAVAARAECSPSLINYHFGDFSHLMDAVMGEAVRRRSLKVVAEGLACNHPRALIAPDEVKEAAAAALVGR